MVVMMKDMIACVTWSTKLIESTSFMSIPSASNISCITSMILLGANFEDILDVDLQALGQVSDNSLSG